MSKEKFNGKRLMERVERTVRIIPAWLWGAVGAGILAVTLGPHSLSLILLCTVVAFVITSNLDGD